MYVASVYNLSGQEGIMIVLSMCFTPKYKNDKGRIMENINVSE